MDLSTTFASIRKQVAGLSVVALVTGLFATGVATAATGNIYSDVPADAWFAPYVNGLSVQGVIDSTQTMYRPGDLVNRAEMAKLAFMVSGLPLEAAAEAPYKDVAMGEWYTNYVYTLTKNGIVSGDKLNGVPTGFFRPSENLNRAEASKMLVNSAQMAEDLSGAPHFPDVTTSYWFYNYVETLFNHGVVAGYPDGYFRPANNINRAEVAKMVYLSMNPVVAGFKLSSAAAASTTKVELIFSMNVDDVSAEKVANYAIEDSSGSKLEVTAAEVVAGDTVHLTTKTQTAGKVYYVTVKDIESEAGDMLSVWDSVSFLGYGADVSGGPLTVSLSTQTPVAGSIPQGATGVVFTCWDFKAGSETVVLKSLHVQRVGPGSETAFDNVYLYRGDMRLTTGRSINNETQKVEFNNINQNLSAGENAKICLVADLNATSNGGVHAFQLVSADDVVSNSSSMTGSFPLRGADQLITTATVGTTTVKKNGSLDEITIGEKDARIAQFEIVAGSTEDQELRRIALYIRGRVASSNIQNLKLYVVGESAALATASSVGEKDLATLVLTKPYKIGRGQSKIFYVTADVTGARSGDDIKVYLDETTDVLITGTTYGYGTQVTIAGAAGIGYDGAEGPDGISGTADDNYSYVLLKGSKFQIGFEGPSAADLPINQKQARCMDLTITNAAGLDVTIKDWDITVTGPGAPGAANGLIDSSGVTNVANYTLIKLVRLNDDGTVSGTLLGSNELNTAGSDVSQPVTLKGTSSVSSGESIKAAIVFDIANNAALNGDTIQCTLQPVTGVDMVKDSNNDTLGAANITPSSSITGNVHTIVTSALTFTKNSSPASGTKYAKGTNKATLFAFQAKAGSSLDTTIKSMAIKGDHTFTTATATATVGAGVVTGFVITDPGVGYYTVPAVTLTDVAGTCTAAPTATATVAGGVVTGFVITNNGGGLCGAVTVAIAPPALSTTDIKDLVDSIGIYDESDSLVSDLKSFGASAAGSNSSIVTFNNLNIEIAKSTTKNLFIKGNVSNSLASAVDVEFFFDATVPLVLDQNGQTVTGVDISAVDGTVAVEKLQLVLGTTPTVAPTVTAANDPKIFSENQAHPTFAFTLKSSDGNSTLQDMSVYLNTSAALLPVSSIALYSASASGVCDGSTMLKDYESIIATAPTAGYVKFTNIGKALLDSQNNFFCVHVKAKAVSSGQPVSNSDISYNNVPTGTAITFDKVQDQSGATLAVPGIVATPTASAFFMGVPTFANQTIASTALTNGAELEVVKFTAGNVGPVNTLNQLAVTFEGVAPLTCNLYRGATLVSTGGAAVPGTGGQTFFFYDGTEFPAGGTSWNSGLAYTVKCTYLGVLSGDSSRAKLAPVALGAGEDSAIIWDDGNGAALTDLAFALIDNILFLDNVEGPQLSASF